MTSERHIPEAVLDATRECVLAVGVRRTTLTDVARRAGVSRMTLYRRVPDVTALVMEVMTREFDALVTAAEHDVDGRGSARQRLVEVAVQVVGSLPEQPLFRRVLDVDPELLLPYLTDRLGTTQQIASTHVRRLLAEGRADGSVRADDLDVMAYTLVTTVSAFVVGAQVTAAASEPKRVADELRLLLDRWLAP